VPKLLLIISFLAATTAANATCLPGDPSIVHVSGVLKRITFAGRPNYEDVAKGDEPETYFVLFLNKPVCLADKDQTSASELQLFLRPEQYDQLRPKLNRATTLSGSLWHAETGHHHTPLMFTPTDQDNEH
jgi:hypothetical protein